MSSGFLGLGKIGGQRKLVSKENFEIGFYGNVSHCVILGITCFSTAG